MNCICSYCESNINSGERCFNCGAKAPDPLKVDNLIKLLITKASNHPLISGSIEKCLLGAKESANKGQFSVSVKINTLLPDQQSFLRETLQEKGFRVSVYSKEVDLSWGQLCWGIGNKTIILKII